MPKSVKATDIDLNQIIFGKLEDSPFVKSQKSAQIHYGKEGAPFNIQSLEILHRQLWYLQSQWILHNDPTQVVL